MKLDDLLKGITFEGVQYKGETEINEVHFDSRKLREGDVFVAQRGVHIDGHDYIGSAIESGATVIICEELPTVVKEGVVYVVCKDASLALGLIAANYYGNPSRQLKLVGVTSDKIYYRSDRIYLLNIYLKFDL